LGVHFGISVCDTEHYGGGSAKAGTSLGYVRGPARRDPVPQAIDNIASDDLRESAAGCFLCEVQQHLIQAHRFLLMIPEILEDDQPAADRWPEGCSWPSAQGPILKPSPD
jgi:hypothetical protein